MQSCKPYQMKQSNISKLSKLGISSGMRYERGDLVTISGDDTIWKIDEAIPNSDFRLVRLNWFELIWYEFKTWWYERKLNRLQKKMNKKNQPGIGGKPFKLTFPAKWSRPIFSSIDVELTVASGHPYKVGDIIQMDFREADEKVRFKKVTKVKAPNIYMLGDLTRWDRFKMWIRKIWNWKKRYYNKVYKT